MCELSDPEIFSTHRKHTHRTVSGDLRAPVLAHGGDLWGAVAAAGPKIESVSIYTLTIYPPLHPSKPRDAGGCFMYCVFKC